LKLSPFFAPTIAFSGICLGGTPQIPAVNNGGSVLFHIIGHDKGIGPRLAEFIQKIGAPAI
jgi:hypothetical protein